MIFPPLRSKFPVRFSVIAMVLLLTVITACTGGCESEDRPKRPPLAPTGFFAVGPDSQVSLFWSASASAVSYTVKRGPQGGPYAAIGTTTDTLYADTGLVNGNTYYYVVSATNSVGESPDSSEASATPEAGLAPLGPDDESKNHIGMNVWFCTDWDGSHAFVDIMKHGRYWMDADWKNAARVDENGWPLMDASTVLLTGTPAEVNGTYRLIFVGQAEVSLMWAAGSVDNVAYDAATNTTTADVHYAIAVTGSVGLVFRNTRRTASAEVNSGFANARLYRPGYAADGSAVFTTPFLNAIRKTSVVRMMDWTYINHNLVERWADRTRPEGMLRKFPPYVGPAGSRWNESEPGIALEHQIQLCNEIDADFWVNIPVAADDEYIRKAALAIRYGTDGVEPYTAPQANPKYPPLEPGRRVYIEYANEIWNSTGYFFSFGVIKDIVQTLPASHPVNFPAEENFYYRMWRYPAWRMTVISDIFRNVYGSASMMNRVRPLLMTQQGNGQATLSTALEWLDDFCRRATPQRTADHYLYGAGGSGYYNPTLVPADYGNADIFFAEGSYPSVENVRGMGLDAVWAMNYGLKRIAYEGGPSLDNYTDEQAANINNDVRMIDMIEKTHDAWSGVGGDLLVYYCLTGPQEWNFTHAITTTATRKFAAIDNLMARPRAAVTLGSSLPGMATVDTANDYVIRTGWGYDVTVDGVRCIAGNPAGTWIALPGHSAAAFNGSLRVRGSSGAGCELRVWINGVAIGTVTLAVGEALADSTALAVSVPKGLVVVRMEVVSGDYALRGVTVD